MRFLRRGVGDFTIGEDSPWHDRAFEVARRRRSPSRRSIAPGWKTDRPDSYPVQIGNSFRQICPSSSSSVPSTRFALSRIASSPGSSVSMMPARSSCSRAATSVLSALQIRDAQIVGRECTVALPSLRTASSRMSSAAAGSSLSQLYAGASETQCRRGCFSESLPSMRPSACIASSI